MLKLKTMKILFASLAAVGLALPPTSSGANTSGENLGTMRTHSVAKYAPKFSSAYTDTTKQCEGAEPTFTCKGYGNYRIVMGVGGVFADARVESTKSDYSLPIAGRQSVGWNPKIEWRMADGKPFAVILRVDVNDENAEIPKKIGELLIVKGLQGFENIDTSVDAKTPQANEKARKIADDGYTAGGQTSKTGAAHNSDGPQAFHTSGVYQRSEMIASKSGDYGASEIYLTQSDSQTFALVTIAEGEVLVPVLVEAKTTGKDMRTVEFALPSEYGGKQFKGIVSAAGLKLDNGQVFKRQCGKVFSDISAGEGGDYGGTEIYLTDANGKKFALVTVAEGVMRSPILVEAKESGKNSDEIEFTMPSENGARKFTGTISSAKPAALTLYESEARAVLKEKCYK